MDFRSILFAAVAVIFVIIAALEEFGEDQFVSHIGRWVIRFATLGYVRLPAESINNTAAISVGGLTLVFFFLLMVAFF